MYLLGQTAAHHPPPGCQEYLPAHPLVTTSPSANVGAGIEALAGAGAAGSGAGAGAAHHAGVRWGPAAAARLVGTGAAWRPGSPSPIVLGWQAAQGHRRHPCQRKPGQTHQQPHAAAARVQALGGPQPLPAAAPAAAVPAAAPHLLCAPGWLLACLLSLRWAPQHPLSGCCRGCWATDGLRQSVAAEEWPFFCLPPWPAASVSSPGAYAAPALACAGSAPASSPPAAAASPPAAPAALSGRGAAAAGWGRAWPVHPPAPLAAAAEGSSGGAAGAGLAASDPAAAGTAAAQRVSPPALAADRLACAEHQRRCRVHMSPATWHPNPQSPRP
mmetsp:Transcript_8537/g.22840  ORF Transcript_8537/g.22840 Transcript_8537/m.22840 type:complete len:329 (-) Transcript_8537:771-1757(-)